MWNIIFWVFAIIGMITTLIGVVYLLSNIFGCSSSSSSNYNVGTSGLRRFMDEQSHCHYG
jgi:hypothetical protein